MSDWLMFALGLVSAAAIAMVLCMTYSMGGASQARDIASECNRYGEFYANALIAMPKLRYSCKQEHGHGD